MNQAEWMPSPSGERDAIVRRRRLVRHDWMALTFGAAAIVFGVVGITALVGSFLGEIIGFVTFLGACIAGFAAARAIDRRRDALTEEVAAIDDAMRHEFGAGEGWLVDLLVLRGAAPIGSDRGMMWLEDDRLLFSGHRTSFALASGQVRKFHSGMAIRGLRHETTLYLNLDDAAISIQPLFAQTSNQFDPTLAAWSRRSAPEGGQYPPTTPGPGAASVPLVLLGAIFSSMYWLGATALLIYAGSTVLAGASGMGFIVTVLGVAAVASILRLWHPVARWTAWRDLQTLSSLGLSLPEENG